MINVGPTSTGLIDPIFTERLLDMGQWLKINGEAIYESKPWKYQNDTKTPNVWYTAKQDSNTNQVFVYAMILCYPYDSTGVSLYSLAKEFKNNTTVELLGYPEQLEVIYHRVHHNMQF